MARRREKWTTCGGRISQGGKTGRCGCLTDKFGLSRQIIAKGLGEMFYDLTLARSQRVLKTMLQMSKIDPGGLKRAYAGEQENR